MLDWTQRQVQRTDKHGGFNTPNTVLSTYRVMAGSSASQSPSKVGKNEMRQPHRSNPMQAHSRGPHTYWIPPGEIPGGVGCGRAGVLRAWRAVR
jgi:hypothetical protein